MPSLTEDLHAAAARYHRALTPFRPGKRGRSPNREAAYAALTAIRARFETVSDLAAALTAEGVNSGTAGALANTLDVFCFAKSPQPVARYAAFKTLLPLTKDALGHHHAEGRPVPRPARERKDLDG